VDSVMATYQYDFDGWRWEYQLFPDRVVARGGKGEQQRERVIDLAGFSEHPDRERKQYAVERRAAAGVLAGGVLLGAAVFLWPVVAEVPARVLRPLALLALLAAPPVYYAASWLLRRRHWVSRATFKRRDGKDWFDIWLVSDESDEAFRVFVTGVSAAIRSSGRPSSDLPGPAATDAVGAPR
jgi:hypothetical protein